MVSLARICKKNMLAPELFLVLSTPGDVDWIDMAHDRDTWRALVNMVMNLRVP
jgi:hypothetical protein